jgi:hypothetical protein
MQCYGESDYQRRLRRVAQLADASPGELRAVACAADWLDVAGGRDLGRAAVYLVVRGALDVASSGRGERLHAGDAFVAEDASARITACPDATVVTIGVREWRALHALAPGVVAAIERGASRPGSVQRIRKRGSSVICVDESRAALTIVCM